MENPTRRRKGPPESNNFDGIVLPLLLMGYAIFQGFYVRRSKYARLLTWEASFWFAVPLFGLALFYHARYFALYRRVPLLRYALMALSILVMVFGFFLFPLHDIAFCLLD